MVKLFWRALAASVAIATLGVGVLGAAPRVGWSLIVASGLLMVGVLARWVVVWAGTKRVVRWLGDCADHGTVKIQNATIGLPESVSALKEHFRAWDQIVENGADRYFHDPDARRLKMLDTYEPRKLPGLTLSHAKIREWTAEKVSRLRQTADKLQRGEITLKRYRR